MSSDTPSLPPFLGSLPPATHKAACINILHLVGSPVAPSRSATLPALCKLVADQLAALAPRHRDRHTSTFISFDVGIKTIAYAICRQDDYGRLVVSGCGLEPLDLPAAFDAMAVVRAVHRGLGDILARAGDSSPAVVVERQAASWSGGVNRGAAVTQHMAVYTAILSFLEMRERLQLLYIMDPKTVNREARLGNLDRALQEHLMRADSPAPETESGATTGRKKTTKTIRKEYTGRKAAKVSVVKEWLQHPTEAPLEFSEQAQKAFMQAKKKDDLADAIVQALAFARWMGAAGTFCC